MDPNTRLAMRNVCASRLVVVVLAALSVAVALQVGTDDPWTVRFQELRQFQREHGHCRVPKRYSANPSLANWVSKQRQLYKRSSSLTQERIDSLNDIGFCWDATAKKTSDDWWTRFDQFRDATENNRAMKQIPGLAAWLRTQRQRVDTLSDKQRSSLDSVDPSWHLTQYQRTWELRFQQLEAYVAEHGEPCVPISYENKALANWVSHQRKQYNKRQQGRPNDLTEERIQRLNAMGFVWNRWEHEFDNKYEEDFV